jgi:multidrug efflux pump subunit AcrB
MIKNSVKHKSIVILLCLAVLIFGFGMYPYMEMQENPVVDSPIATVKCIYPGATPEDVEKDVIKPLEDSIGEVADIKQMESYCMDSVGVVKIKLNNMSDDEIDKHWDDLKDKVDEAKSDLPSTAYDPVVETDFTSAYGLIIGVSSDNYSYEQLKDVATELKDDLSAVKGVKAVDIDGEVDNEIDINLDLSRLQQYGISITDISTYLQARNINIPGGNLELGDSKVPVQITGEYKSVEEIGNTIIGMSTDTGNTVHLRDVADITRVEGDDSMRATVNNEKGLLVGVKFSDGVNIPSVTKKLNKVIENFEATKLYNDMHLTRLIDQSEYIDSAINLLNSNLFMAVLLVLIVIILAMGIRSAIIVALPIPIVIAAVFAYMNLTDIPLHQVSIMSLIISLSLLVANGIVSNDNMNVYLDRGEDRFTSCTKGVKEVMMPILTSTLTTIASFLPLAMMEGSEGKFVKTLPILVSVALAASFITSLTIVPAMGHLLLLDKEQKEKREAKRKKPRKQHNFANKLYEKLITLALKMPVATIAVFVLIFVLVLSLVPTLKVQLFPPVEREQYVVDVTLKEGTTTDKTAEVVNQICKLIDEDDSVTSYASEIGTGFMKYYVTFMSNQQATNRAQILVNGNRDGISALEKKINENIPAAIVNIKQLEIALPVDHTIEVRISGEDTDTLLKLAEQVKEKMRNVDGAKNIEDNFGSYGYKVSVNVNEEKANMVGITNYEVAQLVRMAINGTTVTSLKQDDIKKDSLPIIMKLPDEQTKDSSSIGNIFITSTVTGKNVPLKQIADITTEKSLSKIMRRDGERTITVGMFVEDGYESDEVLDEVMSQMSTLQLPSGYTLAYGGEKENRTDALKSMILPTIIAVAIIYLIIVLQFGSLLKPLIIMGTIPLSFIGVIGGLKIMDYPIGFMALLGAISLMGVVVNNGIVLLDYINLLYKQTGNLKDAVIEGSVTRLRPIMVGMITTVISLIPMVVTGGPLWAPMASSILFGMLISSVLTMLVVPCAYYVLMKRKVRN